MRIIAGTARSLPLKTIEGLETRPTTDKIKEDYPEIPAYETYEELLGAIKKVIGV